MAWSASESFTLASCIAKSASGIVSRAVDVAFGSPNRVFTGDSGGWFLPVGEIMSARASSTNVETTPSVTASSIASSFVINSIACLGERAVSEVDGDAGRGGEDCACWNSSSPSSLSFVLAWFALLTLGDLLTAVAYKEKWSEELSGSDGRVVPSFAWRRGVFPPARRAALLRRGDALLKATGDANPLSGDSFGNTRGVVLHFTRNAFDDA